MLAKAAAKKDTPPPGDFRIIQEDAARVTEAAQWLGRVTARANRFPDSAGALDAAGKPKYIRDSQGLRVAKHVAQTKILHPFENVLQTEF